MREDNVNCVTNCQRVDPGNILVRASDTKKGFEVILLTVASTGISPKLFGFCIIERRVEKIWEYSLRLGGTDATYKLITGILTGLSWASIQGNQTKGQTQKQKDLSVRFISLVPDIALLLSQVPRELIFLFKTQDLLKLIHDLGATHNQKVQYLIMAKYCSKLLYLSRLSDLSACGFPPSKWGALSVVSAWLNH
ncbi:hypothetical protein L0F63_006957 [Massospora cicadina]|nr:hypothetical protein L0F63_006957 [Massospora cicadina]